MNGAIQTCTGCKAQRKFNTNTDIIINVNTNPAFMDNKNSKINYFLPGPSQEADMGQVQN